MRSVNFLVDDIYYFWLPQCTPSEEQKKHKLIIFGF